MHLLLMLLIVAMMAAGLVYLNAGDNGENNSGDNVIRKGLTELQQITGQTQNQIEKARQRLLEENATETKIYKYRNTEGNWIFSDKAPKRTESLEIHIYRSDANIFPKISTRLVPASHAADKTVEKPDTSPAGQISNAQRLLDQANSLNQQMQQRDRRIEQAIKQQTGAQSP